GFGHDTNAVLILGADGNGSEVPLSDKRVVAAAVLDAVVARLRAAGGPGGRGSTTVDPSVTSAPSSPSTPVATDTAEGPSRPAIAVYRPVTKEQP
ncbi:MAG TPA: hypothetical protein VKQ71_04755, partial [Acidimicrobiales bacterium]|nr:hypothetical protein [Acidimicrobiales bacterium]